MLYIGIDDTDTIDSPGTNQLARRIADRLPAGCHATLILRHQLLVDPRVPYTSQNGSASIAIECGRSYEHRALLPMLRRELTTWLVPGSDPGLCVTERVPPDVIAFGTRCQHELVPQADARRIAAAAGIHLEGFGGTEDGVIGALAAVGLLAGGGDGRVIHRPGWSWPDGFAGPQPMAAILARGVDAVRELRSGAVVQAGTVDVGKRLRPAFREGEVVLLVEPDGGTPDGSEPRWYAVKLP
ncbi:MAG: ABC transporter substrate-binding protein [Gemmatimonadales bacterium]